MIITGTMPPKTTKTLGPLHFEDLEPHRFEDLVRQLIYDFKPWRLLEGTGRTGLDEGFDVRGWELLTSTADDETDTDEGNATTELGNLWLIQCKREKSLTPKKLVGYADDIKGSEIYGVTFVAACEFSKKARDDFRAKLQSKGIQEVHLWGKAELEDMLFQPKNDHLLFAYFGISLVVRRRSAQTRIRHRLSIKKKAATVLGDFNNDHYRQIILRAMDDENYPRDWEKPESERRWRYAYFKRHISNGIVCTVREHFAYLHEDRRQWDYFSDFNDVAYSCEPIWERKERAEERDRVFNFWSSIPQESRAWLRIQWLIPYEDIIAIDGDGDAFTENPLIYFDFDRALLWAVTVELNNETVLTMPEQESRLPYFPKSFPQPT